MNDYAKIEDLVGKTLVEVTRVDDDGYNDTLTFITDTGEEYIMTHYQDCCEGVWLEDVAGGELKDLIGSPILSASKRTSDLEEATERESKFVDADQQWTFYVISTMYVTLTLRWYGSSNGYYSTDVDFYKKK